jgi:hypothetical protein
VSLGNVVSVKLEAIYKHTTMCAYLSL